MGGILRDVFTMGARPIANLNSLRFGSFDHPRTRYLVNGVVAGIGGYGNCIGVPTVGGEVYFDDGYNENILVNAFTLGIVRADRIFRASATGVGNPVIYVGSKTGRDGIHGASLLASAEFSGGGGEKRPTVQVGDPFTEKLLLEACLELMEQDAIVAIQDMGAAGLTSSSVEMAGARRHGHRARSRSGAAARAGHDPVRDPALRIAGAHAHRRARGREDVCGASSRKWDLDACVIGRVTDDGLLRVLFEGGQVAHIPSTLLTDDAPAYERPTRRPPTSTSVKSCTSISCRCRAITTRRYWPCWTRRTSPRRPGCIGSTTIWCGATRSSSPARMPPCCASRAPQGRSRSASTATAATAASIPMSAR